MKITFISDTHNKHEQIERFQLPGGDLIVHCGDSTGRGSWEECRSFVRWFENLAQYKHKVMIAGNHDFLFERAPTMVPALFEVGPSIHYLQDSSVEVEGVKIYGSPWQPEFYNWAFNLPRNGPQLKAKWEAIPLDVDILITHGPRFGVLDQADNRRVGCELLHDVFEQRALKPKVHAFGHIHDSYGMIDTPNGIAINASNLNEQYQFTNPPIHIEL